MSDKALLEAQLKKMYPKLSQDEIDDLLDDLLEGDQPFSGKLPMIAVGLVVAASILGMLAAAVFYTPGAPT